MILFTKWELVTIGMMHQIGPYEKLEVFVKNVNKFYQIVSNQSANQLYFKSKI
uniref:Uncharacterized protein n=1 Tax=Rhizophagus irregularis (strain DAOM 181602 / DAOM 197198 / MUCL 43194) TaxID=747089 RepID=U9T1R2_RHIID